MLWSKLCDDSTKFVGEQAKKQKMADFLFDKSQVCCIEKTCHVSRNQDSNVMRSFIDLWIIAPPRGDLGQTFWIPWDPDPSKCASPNFLVIWETLLEKKQQNSKWWEKTKMAEILQDVLRIYYCRRLSKFALVVPLACLNGVNQNCCVCSWDCPRSLDHISLLKSVRSVLWAAGDSHVEV